MFIILLSGQSWNNNDSLPVKFAVHSLKDTLCRLMYLKVGKPDG